VTAGDGGWLAGTAGSEEPNEPDQGVLWHRGRLRPAGLAFGLDTYLHAVNADGIAVGRVIGADGLSHAIRYRTGYEYLPETGGSSVALDVNVSGAVVGFDGARRLVVWPPEGGPAHELPLPDGAAPYRTAAIDNDGAVVAWAGKPDATGTLRLRGYSWHPDGTRTALPEGDVRDFHTGRVVGAMGEASEATTWSLHGRVTTLAGGAVGVAVNRDGIVVGTSNTGASLVWTAVLVPQPLSPPSGHDAGAVTAINDSEAGGYSFPQEQNDSVPIRWRCR
jgi:hypothetical protein